MFYFYRSWVGRAIRRNSCWMFRVTAKTKNKDKQHQYYLYQNKKIIKAFFYVHPKHAIDPCLVVYFATEEIQSLVDKKGAHVSTQGGEPAWGTVRFILKMSFD